MLEITSSWVLNLFWLSWSQTGLSHSPFEHSLYNQLMLSSVGHGLSTCASPPSLAISLLYYLIVTLAHITSDTANCSKWLSLHPIKSCLRPHLHYNSHDPSHANDQDLNEAVTLEINMIQLLSKLPLQIMPRCNSSIKNPSIDVLLRIRTFISLLTYYI